MPGEDKSFNHTHVRKSQKILSMDYITVSYSLKLLHGLVAGREDREDQVRKVDGPPREREREKGAKQAYVESEESIKPH